MLMDRIQFRFVRIRIRSDYSNFEFDFCKFILSQSQCPTLAKYGLQSLDHVHISSWTLSPCKPIFKGEFYQSQPPHCNSTREGGDLEAGLKCLKVLNTNRWVELPKKEEKELPSGQCQCETLGS